jgi:hypothetical protein
MNAYHGLCLALAAWLLALYLRDRGLRPAACAFGGLVAFWTGTNLTLTYAGHVGKYGTLVFLALATFALGRWGRTKRLAWACWPARRRARCSSSRPTWRCSARCCWRRWDVRSRARGERLERRRPGEARLGAGAWWPPCWRAARPWRRRVRA